MMTTTKQKCHSILLLRSHLRDYSNGHVHRLTARIRFRGGAFSYGFLLLSYCHHCRYSISLSPIGAIQLCPPAAPAATGSNSYLACIVSTQHILLLAIFDAISRFNREGFTGFFFHFAKGKTLLPFSALWRLKNLAIFSLALIILPCILSKDVDDDMVVVAVSISWSRVV